jgi:Flp pilus assembly protein TadG
VLPVFLIVFCAAVEFGAVIADGVSLASAARDGARAGAMAGLTSAQAVQDAESTAAAAATDLIDCTPQSPQATYGGGVAGDVTVTVSCAYHALTPLGPLVTAFLGGGGDEPSTLAATESWRINR